MTILTMVKYEWFEEWKDTTVRKRGDQYHQYKMRFAKMLFDWACTVFPKIQDKVGGPGRFRGSVQILILDTCKQTSSLDSYYYYYYY